MSFYKKLICFLNFKYIAKHNHRTLNFCDKKTNCVKAKFSRNFLFVHFSLTNGGYFHGVNVQKANTSTGYATGEK